MVELRCNRCPNLANDFCLKLKVVLPNGLAKLYYGGAAGVYYRNVTYSGKCGIKEKVKSEHESVVTISSSEEEILEQPQQP